MKKWFIAIGMVLVLSLGVVGVTLAQGPDSPLGQRLGQRAPHPKANFIEPVADLLGMSVDDLRAELKSGKTLEEVVTEKGFTMADVANVVYDAAIEQLNQAVADGKITQGQADQIQQNLQERRDACINDGECQPPRGRAPRRGLSPQKVFAQTFEMGLNVSDTLNMDPRDFLQSLRDGATLEDLATQQGVTMDDIADAIVAPLQEKLEQALADGKITQEQADKAQQRLDTFRENCATNGKCMPNFGQNGRGQRPHRSGAQGQPPRPQNQSFAPQGGFDGAPFAPDAPALN